MPSVRVRGSGENAVKSDINVTPLVDVCLVLLIIFMVVTPMLQKGVDVALPQVDKPEKMPEGGNQETIAIKSDGAVYVHENWIQARELPKAFKDMHDKTPDKQMVIKGDLALKYKLVREIMRLVNEAGFPGVGLVSEKNK